MQELPVRCDNGHFYLTSATLHIGIGVRISMRDTGYGPCPVCGADGLIENGTYCIPAGWRGRLAMAWSVLRRGYV